jgi:hypothetical protein
MFVVKEILPDGHENLAPAVLSYMQSMADRHGFTVIDEGPIEENRPVRIQINYELLRDPSFLAVLEVR